MGATEMLKHDHQILRAKLKLLESAMQLLPESTFVLREMCWSLARMLEQHIQREVEVLRPYRNRIQALTNERMAEEHADQQIVLQDVNALLLGGMRVQANEVLPLLSKLLDELREHMDEEERHVFPLVDRIVAERSHTPVPVPPIPPLITEDMTINRVLHLYPTARNVFKAFQVDCEVEGLHGLDELHWRRGVDVSALLRVLNQAVNEQRVVHD